MGKNMGKGFAVGKLSTRQIDTNKGKRVLIDGDGLRLVFGAKGKASWVLRTVKDGREYNIGLGSYPIITLSKARELVVQKKKEISDGLDPILEKRKKREMLTFEEAALKTFEQLSPTFKNDKHKNQWINDLKRYIFPKIGNTKIDQLKHEYVVDALASLWVEKHVTAKRIKQRIKAIVDWAVGRGYREHALPMGAIDKALPKVSHKPKHHAALQYSEISKCLGVVKSKKGVAALAIQALILTAARSGEIRGARWSEFDFENDVWTIPAERMKAKAEHKVPLSKQAKATFEAAKKMQIHKDCDLVFHGQSANLELSDNILTDSIQEWGFDVTIHGFRSTFRDWIANETQFDGDLAEMALAHTIKNHAERAYRRGNMLEKRREMMNAWASYCEGKGGNIVKLVAK